MAEHEILTVALEEPAGKRAHRLVGERDVEALPPVGVEVEALLLRAREEPAMDQDERSALTALGVDFTRKLANY